MERPLCAHWLSSMSPVGRRACLIMTKEILHFIALTCPLVFCYSQNLVLCWVGKKAHGGGVDSAHGVSSGDDTHIPASSPSSRGTAGKPLTGLSLSVPVCRLRDPASFSMSVGLDAPSLMCCFYTFL